MADSEVDPDAIMHHDIEKYLKENPDEFTSKAELIRYAVARLIHPPEGPNGG